MTASYWSHNGVVVRHPTFLNGTMRSFHFDLKAKEHTGGAHLSDDAQNLTDGKFCGALTVIRKVRNDGRSITIMSGSHPLLDIDNQTFSL